MNLTVRDTAKLLQVSEKTIYRWINQGEIPVCKVQDQYRFNRAELLEWATSRKIGVSPEIFSEPDSASQPMPSILEAIQTGGIHYRVEGAAKEDVLRSVVELMQLPEGVNKEFLLAVLLTREELGSTAIGNGIAIPHVRNPLVLFVAKPFITLCFLEKPLEFGALDGQPVRALFTLVSPTVRGHLHLLSRLSFALHDPGFSSIIKSQGSREEIFNEIRRVESGIGTPGNTQAVQTA
ncbi:MAG: PTS sugar transporter subunit IIA [Candidatus Sumerlaeota bacterium]|nr:PTS sugar transporter subunit IIA [Candidatus Sumerlaeota bacterium]